MTSITKCIERVRKRIADAARRAGREVDEIQLIDGKYRLHPTLFRGSKLFDVDNINNDKFQELITVVNQTVLVCYQVPVLK